MSENPLFYEEPIVKIKNNKNNKTKNNLNDNYLNKKNNLNNKASDKPSKKLNNKGIIKEDKKVQQEKNIAGNNAKPRSEKDNKNRPLLQSSKTIKNKKPVSNIMSNKSFVAWHAVVGGTLAIALATLTGLTIAFANEKNSLGVSLESVYSKNYYELVDNVNNIQTKLSKVLASTNNTTSKKLLNEVSKNASGASDNLAVLPVTIGGIDKTISFINKIDGYTTSLALKLENGELLKAKDFQSLEEIAYSVRAIQESLNNLNKDFYAGYSFTSVGTEANGDYNIFTLSLGGGENEVDYPSMIYDGPFSESVVNAEVKGLSGDEIDEGEARNIIQRIFELSNPDEIEYLGQTEGRFATHDFTFKSNSGNSLFAQISKVGGELITVSGAGNGVTQNIDADKAKALAESFASRAGLENMQCVWWDLIDDNAYLNLAPVEEGIILYPDLVKVKVDLDTGEVIGYEATAYFTNHMSRSFTTFAVQEQTVRQAIPSEYNIISIKKALIPIEFNQEALTYEAVCVKNNEKYYIYVSAATGETINILKVVNTENGNQLL